MHSFAVGAACLLVSACATTKQPFTDKAFVHPDYPYAFHYVGEGPDSPMGEDWRLDNYVTDGLVPRQPKSGSSYEIERGYDVDDDGETDTSEIEPYFDLLFDHKRTDARIWVRTVPISGHDGEKRLEVFAERYVRAASGAGSVLVPFGSEGGLALVETRVASRILANAECAVAGQPAYRVDFELANVDELQLSKDARWSHGRLVIVRTPFHKDVARADGSDAKFPVLMLIGVSSTPSEFGAIAPDFGALLDHIALKVNGQSASSAQKSTCNSASEGGEQAPVIPPAPTPNTDAPAAPAAPEVSPPAAEPAATGA